VPKYCDFIEFVLDKENNWVFGESNFIKR
jgi:hypothetical protein